MVQLSLLAETCGLDLETHIAQMSRRALDRGVIVSHVERAERATRVRFSMWRGRPLDGAEISRTRAYYDAVVRRAVITSRDGESRERFLQLAAASIEADLVAGGWARERAAAEAARTVGIDVAVA